MSRRLTIPRLSIIPLTLIAGIGLSGSPRAWAIGGSVGNGGHSITCVASAANDLSGTYALDFILTGISTADLAPQPSVAASLERIYRLMVGSIYMVPQLEFSLRQFKDHIFNTTDAGAPMFWRPMPEDVALTRDQRADATLIPENCKIDGEPNARQAFVHFGSNFNDAGTETTTYLFEADEMARLEATDPLQLSLLLVHEWLWNVSPDVELNRKLNRFLHSREIDTLDPMDVRRKMESIGLDFTRVGLGAGETVVTRGGVETSRGLGPTREEACLAPRQEYARLKLKMFAMTCEQKVPAGHQGRIVSTMYRETAGESQGEYYCFVNWSYACVARR